MEIVNEEKIELREYVQKQSSRLRFLKWRSFRIDKDIKRRLREYCKSIKIKQKTKDKIKQKLYE